MEFIDIEEKIQRKLRSIYESGIELSFQRQKGFQATYSDFVKATMDSKVSKCCNGASEVSYDDNPLVQFLWDTVAPIINIFSDKMKHFLKKFGVSYDEVIHSVKPFRNQTIFSKYTSLMFRSISFVMLEILQALLKLIMVTIMLKQNHTKTAIFRRKKIITMETLMSLIYNTWRMSSILLMENRNQKLFMMEMEMMIMFLMTYFLQSDQLFCIGSLPKSSLQTKHN